MIAGLDSSTPPTAAQVASAAAAGYRKWSGYIATKPGVGLLRAWSRADFDVARACGSTPIGFYSGWDDPLGIKTMAAAWNVMPCLDVESGIRGDGPWVQQNLNESGAGLYGNLPVFLNRTAPFFINAGYPGNDPGRTWPTNPPSVPHGWQWQGTTTMFGVSVDLTWFDDYFGDDMTPEEHNLLAEIHQKLSPGGDPRDAVQFIINDPNLGLKAVRAELDALKAQVAALQPGGGGPLKVTLTGTAQP